MSILLESIARDNPARITHPKQVTQLQELRRQGLVSFNQKYVEGRLVLFDIKLLKAKEVPLASREDFYTCKSQSLL